MRFLFKTRGHELHGSQNFTARKHLAITRARRNVPFEQREGETNALILSFPSSQLKKLNRLWQEPRDNLTIKKRSFKSGSS